VVTVESDERRAALVAEVPWPPYVRLVTGDAVEELRALGTFDLIFADAQGGKWDRLDLTIRALRPSGFLVTDDMTPQEWWEEEQREKQSEVTRVLLAHADLTSTELDWATGLILCVRTH